MFEGVAFASGRPGNAADPRVYAVLVPLAILIVGTAFAYKSAHLDDALGIMVCSAVLVSPVVWVYYFVFALIPIVQLLNRPTSWRSLLRGWGGVALACAVWLSVPGPPWIQVAHRLVGESFAVSDAWTTLPALPRLLMLMPTLAVGVVCGALILRNRGLAASAVRYTTTPALAQGGLAPTWEAAMRGGDQP